MLNVFKCPNCGKKFQTDQGEGQTIPCPYCDEEFTINREHAASKNPASELFFRLAIPLGYVLFVAVPLTLTMWYLTKKAEEQPTEKVETTPAVEKRNEAKPPVPRPTAKPRKDRKPTAEPGEPEDDPEPVPAPKPMPPITPVMPMTPAMPPAPVGMTEVAIAPEPRELPEVFVAPDPHPILWRLPLLDYSSKWQKVGAVDLRVAGIAVTKVPVVDSDENVTELPPPTLVILVEARLNTTGKMRALSSWRNGLNHHAVIFLEDGKELAPITLPRGTKANTGLPFKQPLPNDGTAVRDVLMFTLPPEATKELSLRLEAERCGESGDVWFKIPASALKK